LLLDAKSRVDLKRLKPVDFGGPCLARLKPCPSTVLSALVCEMTYSLPVNAAGGPTTND
jgi:hypothetical protein